MRKNCKKKIIFIFLVLVISGLLFAYFYAPRFITEVRNPLLAELKSNYIAIPKVHFENNSLKGKYINFKSFDGIDLVAYLSYSNTPSDKGTIILLHGIRSYKEHFLILSQTLTTLGYNLVAVDLRAHGQSGGQHTTFGVKEKKDISQLIDSLFKEESINNIGIWGQSLGGAIALQAMAADERIKFGVIESAFSDFPTIVHDYVEYHSGFDIKPVTDYLIVRAGKIAAFVPSEASPRKYGKEIHQPVLMVHGTEDAKVSLDYAKENYESIVSKNKKFVKIEGAGHLNIWQTGADDYFNAVFDFIEEHSEK